MDRIFLYKFGVIGVLIVVALWSFYALPDKPDKDKKNIEQKALIDRGLVTPTDRPKISVSPNLTPTPKITSPTLIPSPTFSTITPTPQIIYTLTPASTPTSTPNPLSTSSSSIPTASPTPLEQSTQPQINPTPTPTPILTPTPTPIPTPNPTPTPTQSACLIKGNISSSGDKIYHMPRCASYNRTEIKEEDGERWFCTEEEAVTAGWRKAQNCPQ